MQVHVIGINVSPPVAALTDQRLEELAFDTVRDALASAGVARTELDSVTLATSDEMDGRAISSMLMAAPSGAYLKDEIRVTDSGMTGLALGAMRIATGRFDLGLVVSWNNTSVIDVQALMRMRAEPFFLRPIGMNGEIASALRASSASYAQSASTGIYRRLRGYRPSLTPLVTEKSSKAPARLPARDELGHRPISTRCTTAVQSNPLRQQAQRTPATQWSHAGARPGLNRDRSPNRLG
jgi:hypothetical protein